MPEKIDDFKAAYTREGPVAAYTREGPVAAYTREGPVAAYTREGPVDLRSEEQVKQPWLRTGQ